MDRGGKLTIEADELDDHLHFSFTDTGRGIPEEIQGSIFRSFITLGKRQGTGLGLAVAREVVEAHGGAINFTTVQGGGTTFLVSLPVA
jgi:two-component system, NtrC family, sensor kinase